MIPFADGRRRTRYGSVRFESEEESGVRFNCAESICDPNQYVPLAIEAERAGGPSFTLPDSICYPRDSDSKYPYTRTGIATSSEADRSSSHSF